MRFSELNKKIAITGMGSVSVFGKGIDVFSRNVEQGQGHFALMAPAQGSNVRVRVSLADEQEFSEGLDPNTSRYATKLSKMAALAGKEALAMSGMACHGSKDVGVLVGTALSGTVFRESVCSALSRPTGRVSPLKASRCVPNESVGTICLELGLKGYNTIVSSFASSSVDALFQASLAIVTGKARAMLVVGAEELSPFVIESLWGMGLLEEIAVDGSGQSGSSNLPQKHGLCLGEGAAAVLLEDADSALNRGADILGFIEEISIRSSSGSSFKRVKTMAETMKDCLDRVPVVDDVLLGYISANANGDRVMDGLERNALRRLLGQKSLPVTALKRALGETFGAAGLFQLVSALCGFKNRGAPLLEWPGQKVDAEAPPTVISEPRMKSAIINNFSPMGNYSSVLTTKEVFV